jgi:hypothetical protein
MNPEEVYFFRIAGVLDKYFFAAFIALLVYLILKRFVRRRL